MMCDPISSMITMCFGEDKEWDMTEFNKLKKGLDEKGIQYEERKLFDGKQILCRTWDAVIHKGSYGHHLGLLEIYGDIVRKTDDTVEGFMTAEEILSRL